MEIKIKINTQNHRFKDLIRTLQDLPLKIPTLSNAQSGSMTCSRSWVARPSRRPGIPRPVVFKCQCSLISQGPNCPGATRDHGLGGTISMPFEKK